MPFPWHHPVRVPSHGRAAMYQRELEERAALLYRLGYPKAVARARLASNVAWDFQIGADDPPSAGDIETVVDSIYRRGGMSSGAPSV